MAYDATAYINDAIHEVVKTLIDTLLIVMVVIFLFLGSVPIGHRADRRDSDFANRRAVSNAAVRFHAEPADPCSRSCFRSDWSSMTRSLSSKTSNATCAKECRA